MSRPLGIKARAILGVITDQPATVSGLAARLQLSRQDAFVQVSRLVSYGYARYGAPIPRAGRPARWSSRSARRCARACRTGTRWRWR
jgi:predicted ArsR family transcriptional regulator